MKILFVSHTPAGGPFVVGSHHLASALAKMGHDVAHLSPPVTPAHILRSKAQFERVRIARWWRGGDVINGATDLIPCSLMPWEICRRLSKNPQALFFTFTRRSITSLLRSTDMLSPDIVFIDEPRLAGIVNLIQSPRIVYRPTDIYKEIRNDPSVTTAERYLISQSQKFIATSQPVANHLKSLGVNDVLIMENGVDIEHFQNNADMVGSTPDQLSNPIAIYAGALDNRFGFDSLSVAASMNPHIRFQLLGPVTTLAQEKLGKLENVQLLGAIPFSELPSYLRKATVAMLPLSDAPSNEGRSPMKLFEYAALGLPIIATRTSELARRDMKFVALANSPNEFGTKLGRLVSGDMKIEDGRPYAAMHSWQAKAQRAVEYASN
jgi:glycosyltransferase involved in cell wall biosynthesis